MEKHIMISLASFMDLIVEALVNLHEKGIYNIKTYHKKVMTKSLNEYHEYLKDIYW